MPGSSMLPINNMRYWIHFSIACLVTAYIVIGYIAFSLFWPVKTLTITNYEDNNPIKVATTTVERGQKLEYGLSYCKYTNLVSTVRRTLIDGQTITLTPTQGAFPLGCRTQLVTTTVIPDTINPGRYYLDVIVEYQINPFRTEYIHYKTEYFDVIK